MSSKYFFLGLCVALCCFALLPSALYAQSSSTGTVAGTVTDPSGAAVDGAKIVLTDKATNVPREGTTNDTGRFLFVDVQAGTYSLSISRDGFRTSRITDQAVNVN